MEKGEKYSKKQGGEIEELRRQNHEYQSQIKNLQNKLTRSQNSQQQTRHKLRQSLIRNGRKTTEEINNLSEDLAIDRRLNQVVNEENENLQNRNNELAGQLASANQQIETLKKAGKEALNLLAKKVEELEKLHSQIEKIKQNQQKPLKTSSWKKTTRNLVISYLAGFGTYGTYN